MKYFFIVHFWLPNIAIFELPLYVHASSIRHARILAKKLANKIKKQFNLTYFPSSPCLVMPNSLTQSYANLCFSNLKVAQNSSTVTSIILPVCFSKNIFSQDTVITTQQGELIVRANGSGYSPFYSL